MGHGLPVGQVILAQQHPRREHLPGKPSHFVALGKQRLQLLIRPFSQFRLIAEQIQPLRALQPGQKF